MNLVAVRQWHIAADGSLMYWMDCDKHSVECRVRVVTITCVARSVDLCKVPAHSFTVSASAG